MGSKPAVGGQAVIEGVMMRTGSSLAVVCRRPDGSIVITEDVWQPIWASLHFLRWPLLRGSLVLLESMVNGVAALNFSAHQQASESRGSVPLRVSSSPTTIAMIAVSLVFSLALFVGAPHLGAWALGSALGFDAALPIFHVVDGALKLALLVGYLAAISMLDDVQRLFQYHGAEHKAIFTYEQGLALTVENARKMSRFHPRCGTSFLLVVIGVSALLFSLLLSVALAPSAPVEHLLTILIKMALMFPVAGLSYELIKLAGTQGKSSGLARAVSAPGMWLQKISTREPDDAQLEIALLSIRKTLWRQAEGGGPSPSHAYEVFTSADEIDLPLVA